MRTHVEIDEAVLSQVQHLGNFSTKKAAITAALNEYLNALKRQRLLALRGKVQWQGDLDQLRTDRSSSTRQAL
jgi:Arc/MetJ family transcription regulator